MKLSLNNTEISLGFVVKLTTWVVVAIIAVVMLRKDVTDIRTKLDNIAKVQDANSRKLTSAFIRLERIESNQTLTLQHQGETNQQLEKRIDRLESKLNRSIVD